MRMLKKSKRVFALLIVSIFSVNQVLLADEKMMMAGVLPSQSEIRTPLTAPPDAKEIRESFYVPVNAGTLKNTFQGKGDGYVIHIQDAHINQEIQKNMASMIDFYAKHYGVKTIYLEGASGELSHKILSAYPNAKARRLISEMFLEQGFIGGAEYLTLTKRPDLVLQGVEDEALYEKNRQAFLNAQESKEVDEKVLGLLRSKMEALAHHVLPEPMTDWLKQQHAFQQDEISLQQYIPYLLERCSDKAPCGNLPHLRSFMRLKKLSGQFHSKEAGKEWPRLIDSLKWDLNERDRQELLRRSELYRLKQISRRQYAAYVATLISGSETLNAYPNLKVYFEMLKLASQLGSGLFEEIRKAEEALQAQWIQTPEQARLARFFKVLEIYEKIFSFSLNREDAEFFYRNREEFQGVVLQEQLNRFFEKYRFEFSLGPGEFKILDQDLLVMEEFYRAAMDRDEVLVRNTVENMKRRGEKVCVLVTGGFHTPRIESYLRGRNISYSVVLPSLRKQFDPKEDQRIYAEMMKDKATPFSEILSSLRMEGATVKAKDPRFQLQPRRRLPLTSQMAGLPILYTGREALFVKQLQTLGFLNFTLDAILALSLQGMRLDPRLAPQYPGQIGAGLSIPEKRLAAAFYPLLHDPASLRSKVSVDQGRLLTPFHPSFGMAVEAEWFPLRGVPRQGSAVKQEVYMKTPDSVVTRARIIDDPDQYRSVRSRFARTSSDKTTSIAARTNPLRIPLNQIKPASGPKWSNSPLSRVKETKKARVESVRVPPELPMDPVLVGNPVVEFEQYDAIEEVRSELRCGNEGALVKRQSGDREILPAKIERLMERMGRVTKTRGEQAAGRVVFTDNGSVYKRVVNPKRSDLAVVLKKRYRNAARRNIFRKNAQDTFMVMEHYRYGTSSAPHELETHPHRWLPERKTAVWKYEAGKWVKRNIKLSTYITHNGDFDDWNIFGADQNNFDIGMWLTRVLQHPNETFGDSPKVAGMMDLLLTQGMWDASARLAYQLEIANSLRDAFGGEDLPKLPKGEFSRKELLRLLRKQLADKPNTAPSAKEIKEWGAVFEKVFEKFKHRIFVPDPMERRIVAEVMEEFESEVVEALITENIGGAWDQNARERFVKSTIKAFLENDLNKATKTFMKGAKGSFGLVTASTLEPEHVIVSARGQPMSVGFNRKEGLVTWASEAAALKVPYGEREVKMPYRMDLDQINGEIMDLSLDGIRLYSEKLEREVSEEELHHAGRVIDLLDNPYVEALDESVSADRVGDDIRDIPRVLMSIAYDWKNEDGYNRQTAQDFLEMAADQAKARWYTPDNDDEQDLLIVGTEISGSLGQKFVADYKLQYPKARVHFVSANQFLLDVKKKRIPYIGSKTMVLSISQSGQTFPSLNATITLEKMLPGRVFVMTGEIDSLMGSAVGQHYYKGAPFSRRIFTNGSGRRPSEPSTVAAAAAHQTLTELLLFMGSNLPKASGLTSPFGSTFTESHIHHMYDLRDSLVHNGVTSIVGYNARGDRVLSPESQLIRKQGKKWASHILEPAITVAVATAYTIAALKYGFPVSSVPGLITEGISQIAKLWEVANVTGIQQVLEVMATAVEKISPYAADINTTFAVLFPLFFAWGHRVVTGRTMGARLGKRTLVIGDIPYVHYLLEQYVSKLFSMSYGWASIDVHGSNPADEMVHEFGHRIVRGTLIFLGRPDGILLTQKSSETDHLMTAKQGKGVQNLGVGAEVMAVGHNPLRDPNAMDSAITLWAHTRPKGETDRLEDFYEARFSSFERLLTGFVLFHAMADKVSKTRPIRYDNSRTQSGTRVATTRAPVDTVSATEIMKMISGNGNSYHNEPFPKITEEAQQLPFKVLPPVKIIYEEKTSGQRKPDQTNGELTTVSRVEAERRKEQSRNKTPGSGESLTASVTDPGFAETTRESEFPPAEPSANGKEPVKLNADQNRMLAVSMGGIKSVFDGRKAGIEQRVRESQDPQTLLVTVLGEISFWRGLPQLGMLRRKDEAVANAIEEKMTAEEAAFASRLEQLAEERLQELTAPRHELREVDFFNALDGKKDLEESAALAGEIDFAGFEKKAAALGFSLTGALENFPVFFGTELPPAQSRDRGEMILNVRPKEAMQAFLRVLFTRIQGKKGIQRITFFNEDPKDAGHWTAFKTKVRKMGLALSLKLEFSDEIGAFSLEALADQRAKELGLSKQEAVQLLDPADRKATDGKYLRAAHLGAAGLAQSTLVVIGSSKPVNGMRHLTIAGILQKIFRNRRLVEKAA